MCGYATNVNSIQVFILSDTEMHPVPTCVLAIYKIAKTSVLIFEYPAGMDELETSD